MERIGIRRQLFDYHGERLWSGLDQHLTCKRFTETITGSPCAKHDDPVLASRDSVYAD
jgi:hypothetical protein